MRHLLLALLLVVPAFALAQEGGDKPPAGEDPAHQALRDLHKAALTAIDKNDLDGLVSLCHEDVVFTATSGEIVRGRKGVSDYFKRMMEGPKKIVKHAHFASEADDLSVLHGGDTAIAFGKSVDTYELTNGEEFVLETRWSATAVKKADGTWELAAFHSSVGVFDNAMLDAAKGVLPWAGGLGAVVGLLIGLIVGRIVGKKAAG